MRASKAELGAPAHRVANPYSKRPYDSNPKEGTLK
jgi:hypothetical protein